MRVVVGQYEGVDNTPALPLAAGCLVSAARIDPALAGARFEIAVVREPIDRAVAALDAPDVLGVSVYPWNAAYSLAVAAEARRAYPGALLVAGGPSVPRRPEHARAFLAEHPAIDVAVFAEGEPAFRALLRAHRAGAPLDAVPGIAFRTGGELVFTSPPDRVYDLDGLASPYLDGTFDELLARHRHRFAMALCETNRGCPFTCTFCDWSLTRHVVEFPIDRVHRELDWIVGHGFNLALTDANFGIRPRDSEIARYLADLRRRTGAPRSVYFYLTKNNHRRNLETIEILHAAGIGCCVGLAVQDFDDGVLEAVKRDNIQTGESMALRTICGDRGIPTHNELILGLPGQSYDSFTTTMIAAMPSYPRHDVVVFLCRLIPNTEMAGPAHRAEYQLETRRCVYRTIDPHWEAIVDEHQELVVGSRDMPVADWRRTFGFVALAGAAYNLRLLRVVMQYLGDEVGADLRGWLGDLCALPEVAAIVDRYLDTILACGPLVLPAPGTGQPIEAPEAIAHHALADPPAFLEAVHARTAAFLDRAGLAAPALDEAFRYQRLLTPVARDVAPRAARFEHDWPAYVAAGGTGARLGARPVALRWFPPHHAALTDVPTFATTHIACTRARLATGEVEILDAARKKLAIVST